MKSLILYNNKFNNKSLPSRECGLKSNRQRASARWMVSLPSRECGLKSNRLKIQPAHFPSLPSRECGLKSFYTPLLSGDQIVTPFAGVWIEIELLRKPRPWFIVTPFAGVWIEIGLYSCCFLFCQSLPSRECGLKYCRYRKEPIRSESLPSRECGLKSGWSSW